MVTTLSAREISILRMLARGKTYEEIREFLNIGRKAVGKPPISPENMHTTAAIIRKKTGIKNTQDPHECRACLRSRHSSYEPNGETRPTRRQMAVLRLVAQGMPYREIAHALGFQDTISGAQSVQNYASQGCKRIGIRVPAFQRTHAIRNWLEKHDAQTKPPTPCSADPMDDPMF